LLAAKEIAARSKRTASAVISEFFRRGLHAGPHAAADPGRQVAAGFEVIPANGRVDTAALVRRLRVETEDA